MADVKGGQTLSLSDIYRLIANSEEEMICYNFLTENCWASEAIFDIFENDNKREIPDPYTDEAIISDQTLIDQEGNLVIYGFTSKTYTASTTIGVICFHTEYDDSEGGYVRAKISVDNGVNYTTVLDTKIALNETNKEININLAEQGNKIIVKLEIETDGTGNGAYFKYFGLIMADKIK